MPATVTIRDEALGGETLHEFALELLTEPLTAREVLRGRVYQEVQDYNLRQPETFRGLVQPSAAESTLNEGETRRRRSIDWKRQFERAVEAFEAGRIVVLVDDRQVESLDEEVVVKPGTVVTFLRLTMLTGG